MKNDAPQPARALFLMQTTRAAALGAAAASSCPATSLAWELRFFPGHVAMEAARIARVGLLALLISCASCAKLYEPPPDIYRAAATGSNEVVRELMQTGVDANVPNSDGLLPLHIAAAAGHVATCWLLLATPWDLTDDFPVVNRVMTERAESEALRSAEGGRDAGVQGYLPKSLDHNPLAADTIRYTWTDDGHLVRSRIAREDVYQGADATETVDRWLGPRAELNAGAFNVSNVYGDETRAKFSTLAGETALHLAARAGHIGVVNLLLSEVNGQAADVDQPSVSSINKGVGMAETALHYAAKNGQTTVARALLDAGAFVDSITTQGWTPLHYAAMEAKMDVITLLVQRGASLNATTHTNVSPLARLSAAVACCLATHKVLSK